MSALDIREAKRSLAWWLREWGVLEDSERKARQFIDDMVDRGWQMAPEREGRPVPPRRDQDCKQHPGQHSTHCGLCRVENYGDDNEQTAAGDEGRRLVETIRARREGKL